MPPRGEIPNDGKNRSREAHARTRGTRNDRRQHDARNRDCDAHAPRESETTCAYTATQESGYPAKETRLTIKHRNRRRGTLRGAVKTDENQYQHVWREDWTQITLQWAADKFIPTNPSKKFGENYEQESRGRILPAGRPGKNYTKSISTPVQTVTEHFQWKLGVDRIVT